MNESVSTWWMIWVCIAFVICLVFSKQLKVIFKLILNSILGLTGLFCVNFFLTPLGLTVGINLLTVIFIGILGLPGLISLYLMQLILGGV